MIDGASKEIYLKVKNPIDLANASSVLLTLIGEKNVRDTFILSDFCERPVIFRGGEGRVSILKSLLFDINVLQMLENTASDQIHVWMIPVPVDNGGIAPSLESISIDDASQAFKLYLAGHSLYCRVPLELENYVIPKILNELQIGINCNKKTDRFSRGEIETFFTRKGHITDFHTDFQENFTIQLSGKKIWRFASSSAKFPLRGCTPHFKVTTATKDIPEQQMKVMRLGDPSFTHTQYLQEFPNWHVYQTDRNNNKLNRLNSRKNPIKSNNNSSQLPASPSTRTPSSTVVISAGDVLYHPAGIWHAVECIEDSISINISLISCSAAEIFCTNLQQLLCQRHSNYRRYLSGDRELASDTIKNIINDLPSLLQELAPGDFLPVSCFKNSAYNNTTTNNNAKSKKRGKDAADRISDFGSQTYSNSDMSENGGTKSDDDDEEDDDEDEEGDDEEIEDIIVVGEFHLPVANNNNNYNNSKGGKVVVGGVTSSLSDCSGLFQPQSRFKVNPLATVICIDDLWGNSNSSSSSSSSSTGSHSNSSSSSHYDADAAVTKIENESVNRRYRRRVRSTSTNVSTSNNHVTATTRSKELTAGKAVAVTRDYVVHSGYGNESLESLNRCRFRVPSEYYFWMEGYKKLQISQCHRIRQGGGSCSDSDSASLGVRKEVEQQQQQQQEVLGSCTRRNSRPLEIATQSTLNIGNSININIDNSQVANGKSQRKIVSNNKSSNNNKSTHMLNWTRNNNRTTIANNTSNDQNQAISPSPTTTTTISTNEFTLSEFLYFCDEHGNLSDDPKGSVPTGTTGTDDTPRSKRQRISKRREIVSTSKSTHTTEECTKRRRLQSAAELMEVLVFSGAITWLD